MRCLLATVCLSTGIIGSCSTPDRTQPTAPLAAENAIVVCGEAFPVDAPVLRWDQRGGYDGYLETGFFDRRRTLPSRPANGCDTPERYGVRACLLDENSRGTEAERIRRAVDQVVIHYDAAGTSNRCFQILHDIRGLSSHFLIDRDGTIYQTLDIRERARHAGSANDRSVGIEIANVGAYETREGLLKATADAGLEPTNRMLSGVMQRKKLYQFPYTDAQYASLTALIQALRQALPGIKPEFPRDRRERVERNVLSAKRLATFQGVLGHHHITDHKVDPGPAFEWGRVRLR